MMNTMDSMMSGSMMWHHYLYMYLYPTVVGVVVLAGIVYLIYWLFAKQGSVPLKKQTPLEILRVRYAKGEVSEKEFEKMKRQLE